jgi:trans-aconitate methyltransferase
MSRLDSFIRRVTAQRDVLDHVVSLIDGLDGPVLELGLGNGRTYHHLRERLPGRRILAFDRALVAHGSSVPPDGDLVLGEIAETAPRFAGVGAALVHADIETAYAEIDAETTRWLAALAPDLARPGGIVASGLALAHPALGRLPVPASVPADRYFLYRRA